MVDYAAAICIVNCQAADSVRKVCIHGQNTIFEAVRKVVTQILKRRIVASDLTFIQLHAAVIELHFVRRVNNLLDVLVIKKDGGFRILIYDPIAAQPAGAKAKHPRQETYCDKSLSHLITPVFHK